MTPLRAASTLAALLLLAAAAGAHGAPADPTSWRARAGFWVQDLQERASWWALRRWPGDDARQHPTKPLTLTLELPDDTLLEVGEDMTAEELLQQLVAAQVGRVGDVEIEVLAVERITRRRPSRVAVLRSALSALGNMLRLATAWKLGGSAIASDAATTAGDATRLPAAWRVGGGVAASSGSAAAELQRQTASGSDAKLAGGAPAERTLWDLAPDTDSDADEEVEQQQATSDSDDEQRLPITAFDDAYVDEEDEEQVPGRRLLDQRAAESAVQQQEEVDWQATKLFGPRTPALQPVQPVLPARHAAAAAATRPIVVRVVVLVVPVGQHPQQQHVLAALAEHLVEQPTLGGGSGSSNGHIADLLDALAMPAAASAATQLGRKAAAGGTANGDAPASFLQRAAAMPALVAAVNCVFVAACTVSLACMVLLARDAWRHGWVVCGSHRCPDAEELRGEQQQQQFCSTAALLVVAADEAAAMAAEEAVWAKGQL